MAVFGCFVSGEALCCHFWVHSSCDKSKTGPEELFFFRLIYFVDDFFDRFHQRIEVIEQIRWE